MTTFNSAGYVGQFLAWYMDTKAFFSHTTIVDDNSFDGSLDQLRSGLAEEIEAGYVSVHALSPNSGRPSIPRNYGIQQSQTEYILMLDIDDLLTRSYLQFLSREAQNRVYCVYSGVKNGVSNYERFHYGYNSDFEKRRLVSYFGLRFKNQVTLSGAFLPREVAQCHAFRNQPLEDWLFWRDIASGGTLAIYRLLDVPVGYSTAPSLSPRKLRQVKRVSTHLPKFGLLLYGLYTFKLRMEEALLSRRVRSSIGCSVNSKE